MSKSVTIHIDNLDPSLQTDLFNVVTAITPNLSFFVEDGDNKAADDSIVVPMLTKVQGYSQVVDHFGGYATLVDLESGVIELTITNKELLSKLREAGAINALSVDFDLS